jgi:type III secretory pathway component EscT
VGAGHLVPVAPALSDGGWLLAVARAFADQGLDLRAWGLAWARVAPAVAIVPAFGLRALSTPVRAASALVFSALLLPAVGAQSHSAWPFPVLLFGELVRGTTIAVAAAVPFWAASMTGGLVDALRGAQDSASLPTVEGKASPLGNLFSLLASCIFLFTGGPARLVTLLAEGGTSRDTVLARVVADLAAGVGMAVALAAPIVAAAVVIEIAGALVARAASPAQLHATLAPVRSVALLAVTALLFDRMASLLAVLLAR